MILSQCCDCREPSVRLLQPAGNTPTILEMDKMKENANFFLACQKMRDSQGSNGVEAGEGGTALGTLGALVLGALGALVVINII